MNLRDADPETAWLAGVFEGEGCAVGVWDPRYRQTYNARLSIGMCDEDVVRECHRVAAIGTIIGPYSYKKSRNPAEYRDCTKWKPIWAWRVYNRADFQIITQRLYPYLGTRRRAKIEEIYREAPWIPEPYFFEEVR